MCGYVRIFFGNETIFCLTTICPVKNSGKQILNAFRKIKKHCIEKANTMPIILII